MSNFRKELTDLINRCSLENESNTPDFILAEYIMRCLENWTETTKHREDWYGKHLSLGGSEEKQQS